MERYASNAHPGRLNNCDLLIDTHPMKPGLVIVMCMFLAACDPFGFSAGPVGSALKKKVREKEITEVDLRKLVPFEWDSLYMFSPYRSREEVCKQLQFTVSQCHRHVSVGSTDDGEMFLVFQLKGEIVHTEMHSRFNGDFMPMDFLQPVTPERSRFLVVKSGVSGSGEPWLKLRPHSDGINSQGHR